MSFLLSSISNITVGQVGRGFGQVASGALGFGSLALVFHAGDLVGRRALARLEKADVPYLSQGLRACQKQVNWLMGEGAVREVGVSLVLAAVALVGSQLLGGTVPVAYTAASSLLGRAASWSCAAAPLFRR